MSSIDIKSTKNNSRYSATLTVSANEREEAINAVIPKIKSNKKLPGFRVGKVPDTLIKQKFASEVKQYAGMFLVEKNIEPISVKTKNTIYKVVHIQTIDEHTLEIIYDIMPSVKLGKLKNKDLYLATPVISDEDVNEILSELQYKYAQFTKKEVQDDIKYTPENRIQFDIELWKSDAPISPPTKEQYSTLDDKGWLPPNIKEHILNNNPKPGVEFKTTFQQEHNDKSIDITAICTIHEIYDMTLPELTDEFIKTVEANEKSLNLKDYKLKMKKDTEIMLQKTFNNYIVNKLLKDYIENSQFILPDSYIIDQIEEQGHAKMQEIQNFSKEDTQKLFDQVIVEEKRSMVFLKVFEATKEILKLQDDVTNHVVEYARDTYDEQTAETVLMELQNQDKKKSQQKNLNSKVQNIVSEYMYHVIYLYVEKKNLIKNKRQVTMKDLNDLYQKNQI